MTLCAASSRGHSHEEIEALLGLGFGGIAFAAAALGSGLDALPAGATDDDPAAACAAAPATSVAGRHDRPAWPRRRRCDPAEK